MIRISVFLIAVMTIFAIAAPAQSQTDEPQTPAPRSSSAPSNKKPVTGPPTDDNPDEILNAPMTPPRSDAKDDSSSEPAPGSYSTSKNRPDISPPADDSKHPGGEIEIVPSVADDVTETKPWNPHEADKDVEVGLYYFKRGNLRAAEARFRDALYWQDNHAEALFRLAAVLEKEGHNAAARENYENYLKILPKGEFSADSRKALERLSSATEGNNKKTVKKSTTSPPS
jgi:tetratricopeptide (TPR) repeat protein